MVTLSKISRFLTALPVVDRFGDTPSTPSMARSVSTSDSVRPRFKAVPGAETDIMPAPRSENSSMTLLVTPWTIVTRPMTAATPITMPSIVRKDRILLLLIFRSAIRKLSTNMAPPSGIRRIALGDHAVEDLDDPLGM